MKLHVGFATLLALAGGAAHRSAAQEAIVEDVTPGLAVERFEYLIAGQTVDLGKDGKIVVSYLRSCWRERAERGILTIGRETSTSAGGHVERVRERCSSGALRLDPREGDKSAVMVFRAPAQIAEAKTRSLNSTITVRAVLFGTAPIIELPGGGRVILERLDLAGERFEFDVPRGQALGANRHDFTRAGLALTAGALYRARYGDRSILFGVHPSAVHGDGPALGRLLRLPPS